MAMNSGHLRRAWHLEARSCRNLSGMERGWRANEGAAELEGLSEGEHASTLIDSTILGDSATCTSILEDSESSEEEAGAWCPWGVDGQKTAWSSTEM